MIEIQPNPSINYRYGGQFNNGGVPQGRIQNIVGESTYVQLSPEEFSILLDKLKYLYEKQIDIDSFKIKKSNGMFSLECTIEDGWTITDPIRDYIKRYAKQRIEQLYDEYHNDYIDYFNN
jgi:hypothetical protein